MELLPNQEKVLTRMPNTDAKALDKAACFEIGKSCACFNLRMAARMVTQRYDEILRPTGLRSTQFGLLVATKAFGPVAVTKLAKGAMMDRTTLARNLGPLEKKRLIEIEPGEDQRVRYVRLTEKGLKALEKAMPFWTKAQAHFIDGLGEDRMGHMLDDLSDLVTMARRP